MNAYQQKTMQVIGRHFGIPRKVLTPIVEQSLEKYNQVYFQIDSEELDSLPAAIKGINIVASKEKEVNISKIWDSNKLVNTSLYAAYNDMQSNLGEDMLFTYTHGSDVYVIHPAAYYEGIGGIFVKENYRSMAGMVIEPLKNWLSYYCPVEEL
jgi:hypothetical protein